RWQGRGSGGGGSQPPVVPLVSSRAADRTTVYTRGPTHSDRVGCPASSEALLVSTCVSLSSFNLLYDLRPLYNGLTSITKIGSFHKSTKRVSFRQKDKQFVGSILKVY